MDRVLVERAMAGDRGAFNDLAALSVGRLYGVAMLILRDPDRASDATQEALIAAWRDLSALRDPGPLRRVGPSGAHPGLPHRGTPRSTATDRRDPRAAARRPCRGRRAAELRRSRSARTRVPASRRGGARDHRAAPRPGLPAARRSPTSWASRSGPSSRGCTAVCGRCGRRSTPTPGSSRWTGSGSHDRPIRPRATGLLLAAVGDVDVGAARPPRGDPARGRGHAAAAGLADPRSLAVAAFRRAPGRGARSGPRPGARCTRRGLAADHRHRRVPAAGTAVRADPRGADRGRYRGGHRRRSGRRDPA